MQIVKERTTYFYLASLCCNIIYFLESCVLVWCSDSVVQSWLKELLEFSVSITALRRKYLISIMHGVSLKIQMDQMLFNLYIHIYTHIYEFEEIGFISIVQYTGLFNKYINKNPFIQWQEVFIRSLALFNFFNKLLCREKQANIFIIMSLYKNKDFQEGY